MDTEKKVSILYTNKKGTKVKEIIPKEIIYGTDQWHDEPTWLLQAYDLNKKDMRSFVMKNIKAIF